LSLELEERERFRFYRLSPEEKILILNKLRDVLSKRSEIVLAIVFGSFLKDYPFRDIDIAIYTTGNPDPLDLKLELEEELEKVLNYPVDIAILNEAPPWFVKKVLKEGTLLFTKQPTLPEKLFLKALDEEKLIEISFPRAP